MRARAAALSLAVALAGCVSYSGGARGIDAARLDGPGWIVAARTPELRQQGSLDCGATSLAMVAGRWGVALSPDAVVASLPAATRRGVALGALRDAARRYGFSAFAIAGDRDTLVHELRAGRPVIVGLLMPYGRRHVRRHYEVVIAMNPEDNRFVTIDPARGLRSRTWAALDAEWGPAGHPTLVVLGPTGLRAGEARRWP